MRVTLTGWERATILNQAKAFEELTGEKYSIRFVMLLLTEKYSERFEADIKDVFDEKKRLYEEQKLAEELNPENNN